jgi:hypothetical protein
VAISVPSPCHSEGGKRLKNLGGGQEGGNNHAEFILSHVRFFAALRMTQDEGLAMTVEILKGTFFDGFRIYISNFCYSNYFPRFCLHPLPLA